MPTRSVRTGSTPRRIARSGRAARSRHHRPRPFGPQLLMAGMADRAVRHPLVLRRASRRRSPRGCASPDTVQQHPPTVRKQGILVPQRATRARQRTTRDRRRAFELRPDGSYVESSPGPVDVPEESSGRWSLEGDRLVLGAEGDRPGHAWEITAVRLAFPGLSGRRSSAAQNTAISSRSRSASIEAPLGRRCG